MNKKTGFSFNKNTRKQIFILLGVLFAIQGILSSISLSFSKYNFTKIFSLIILWGVVIYIFLKVKDKYLPQKDKLVKKFEEQKDDISIMDAFVYSLLSIKDIYTNIPHDRRRIINIALLLIGVAMLFLYMQVGNLFSILSSSVIIAAANMILIRVMTMEREERSRLLDELKVARDMQMSLMPKEQPDFHGHEIYGICQPAKDVGGDFFDFNIADDSRLAISLADVSGKGLDAAMTTLFISGALASEIKHSADCSNILINLNHITLKHSMKGKFIAFFLSILDINQKKLYYINAGQPKPIVKRDGFVYSLNSQGARLPLGLIKDPEYNTSELDLKKDDMLVFYTDGVSEAMNKDNEIYSTEKLEQLLRNSHTDDLSVKEIADVILHDIDNFVSTAEQHDDIALVVIKLTS